jgi:kojibiose phosphorylase
MDKSWQVHTDTFIKKKENTMRNGNVYQIANGYMGYRGTLDEFGPDELVGITLAGIYDRVGDAWREPVNAPNGGFTKITLDGREISALSTRIKKHRQSLNLQNALFDRETDFVSRGKTLKLKSTRFLSADQPHLGIIKYSLSVNKAAKVRIHTGIDCNIWDLNGPHLLKLTPEKRNGILLVHAVTAEKSQKVVVVEAIDLRFSKATHQIAENKNLRVIDVDARANQIYTFYKYFAVYTSNDPVGTSINEAATKTVLTAKTSGFEECLSRHNTHWAKKWEYCDVKIDGDEEAQLALRYSIFQLLMVAPVTGSANSIPARALSGQVYKGAIFWDTEMFMFPFFLYTCPEKAIELLRYRIKTLDGARRKAGSEGAGYRGAFYAWESQETGDEACTYFNIGDPLTKRDLRTYFRDKQVHISGDVAMAMWEYFRITGDDSLLLDGGAEIILECARFYYSYAYFKKDKNRYEVLDVVGPDEYHERVDNNAFTNMVVKATFEIANATTNHLKERYPGKFKALVKKIGIADELPLFEEAAELLYVPRPDEKTGVIEQFDSYHKLKETTLEALKARRLHPNEYLGAGQGLAVPTKIIKQADVVMLLNLFSDRYSRKIKKANWEYYEPRTEHSSSLSACAYAMVAAEIGKLDRAYDYFLKTATIDIEAKYKVHAGTVFMGGSHPAANGGAWMTAVFGFGGVKANPEHLVINPKLYKKWNTLQFNIVYKGDRFSITITKARVTVLPNTSNRRHHTFMVAGKSIVCRPGKLVAVKYKRSQITGSSLPHQRRI